ncbi:MAG: hypothetical protein MIO87_02885 [Methanomassiliicoccales archaeon]|nr:hypothetical protein [Methanomassiliicoccales archaeon]
MALITSTGHFASRTTLSATLPMRQLSVPDGMMLMVGHGNVPIVLLKKGREGETDGPR